MSDTIFGKIIRKELPADLVLETGDLIAFRDINPKAPVHILVAPKKPIKDLASAEKEDSKILGKLLLAAADIARAEGLTGYRLVANSGSLAEVPHLHFHLMGGRKMSWPPG